MNAHETYELLVKLTAALKEVRGGNYRDIDQFFNAGAFWRADDRAAPHNV